MHEVGGKNEKGGAVESGKRNDLTKCKERLKSEYLRSDIGVYGTTYEDVQLKRRFYMRKFVVHP